MGIQTLPRATVTSECASIPDGGSVPKFINSRRWLSPQIALEPWILSVGGWLRSEREGWDGVGGQCGMGLVVVG